MKKLFLITLLSLCYNVNIMAQPYTLNTYSINKYIDTGWTGKTLMNISMTVYPVGNTDTVKKIEIHDIKQVTLTMDMVETVEFIDNNHIFTGGCVDEENNHYYIWLVISKYDKHLNMLRLLNEKGMDKSLSGQSVSKNDMKGSVDYYLLPLH